MPMKKEQVQAIAAAKRTVVEGRLSLWNMRLEASVASGNLGATLDRLTASVEDNINNCGCNVQCGAMREGLDIAGGLASRG